MSIIKEQDNYLSKRDDYMKYSLKNRLFVAFTIGFCFIVFNSTSLAGDSGGIQQKDHSELENPETTSKQKYSYRYYPSCSVYYDVHRKLYYYPEDDNWKIFSSLPSNLERNLGDYIKIEMDDDKPYIDNDKHVKKFPPEDSEKKENNMWSKLILFLFYEHPSK
jgi:hypothetical protein